jgi:hypothetical protein
VEVYCNVNDIKIGKELCSWLVVSFFNELDTKTGTMLMADCFIF